MAVVIDVNTDELKNAVAIARRANEQLTEAMDILNQIVIHTDWECAERDAMNENTSRNRRDINNIQQNCEVFYNNICCVADRFCALEQEISSSFGIVEGPIASFLSLVPQSTAGTSTSSLGGITQRVGNFFDGVSSILRNSNGGVANVMKDAIDIVSFKDIASGFNK